MVRELVGAKEANKGVTRSRLMEVARLIRLFRWSWSQPRHSVNSVA
jgi:hypothetical protein